MKWIKGILFVLSAVFVGMQFVKPPTVNPPTDESIELRAPEHVQSILDRWCRDCHSNDTDWPWYSGIAPVSWWLYDHVIEGREEMSFSEWGTYSPKKQDKKLEEICEEIEKAHMPLREYLWLHGEAKLSDEDKRVLCEWAKSERLRLRAAAGKNANERPRT